MKYLGFNVYSFSFAWTRIFPLGSGEVNEAGLQFYDSLVDELVKNDIKPFATLFHWDSVSSLFLFEAISELNCPPLARSFAESPPTLPLTSYRTLCSR